MARSVAKATHDSGPAVQSNQPREDAASIGQDTTSVVTGERALVKRIVARSAIGRYGRRSKTSSLNPQHIFFMSVEGFDSTPFQMPSSGGLESSCNMRRSEIAALTFSPATDNVCLFDLPKISAAI
jgi:hypothetical protein